MTTSFPTIPITQGPVHDATFRLFLVSARHDDYGDLGMYPPEMQEGATDWSKCWGYIDAILDYRYYFNTKTFALMKKYHVRREGRIRVYVEGMAGIFTHIIDGWSEGSIAKFYKDQKEMITWAQLPDPPNPDPDDPDGEGEIRMPFSEGGMWYFMKSLPAYMGEEIVDE